MRINEIFYSIQGEGYRTGAPTIFVRLAGCSMRCEWCDTKYAWDKGKEMSIRSIINEIEKYNCNWVCITGGEPMEQSESVKELTTLLKGLRYMVQLETNGSLPIVGHFDWITVSPKKFWCDSAISVADEIKLVITCKEDLKRIDKFKMFHVKHFYLQPKDNDLELAKLCYDYILKNPFLKLNLQIQKILNIK